MATTSAWSPGLLLRLQTYSDIPAVDGRRIQIAWMNGGSYPEMPFNQQMSFPCELTLHRLPQGLRLYRYPVKEIQKLYAETITHANTTVNAGENAFAGDTGLAGDLYDISIAFEPGTAEQAVFKVRGESITYNSTDHTLHCLGKSSRLEPINGVVKLRLLIDKTTIELFGNGGRVSMSSCFVPSPENHEISFTATGGPIKINSVQAHTLKSAWPGVH